jgi:hypothetical protein
VTAINTWQRQAGQALPAAPADAVTGQLQIVVRQAAVSANCWLDGVEIRPLLSGTDFADSAVGTSALADASVTQAKIAAAAVGPTQLADNTLAKNHFGSLLTPLQRGSSNPLMSADDLIHRTDKDRIATYNGTQVVSVAPISIPWLPNASLNPFSTSGVDAWYAILPNDMPLYLERWTCLVRGNTTNNASNFWTVALQGFTGGAGTTLDSFTTAALTVNVLTMQHRALTTALTAGQYDFLALIATKTGAPGTLLLIPHLRAREILS